ncbi:Thioredoxin (modular protein) [Desulfamplus magnetovallimortis]|uniref:Thioredoxin (Modular protein) n=1 Tax=Desulfamplus magnetovallimortis TaxID=1246637 RepID=A0A1W1HIS9_9BACT|nr:thioredoxin family protein [Desulfamplus magnetovallimortis]SLM32268.1 Thioredoxin (modular protein) [Desulfamplus magnetovallimortis]
MKIIPKYRTASFLIIIAAILTISFTAYSAENMTTPSEVPVKGMVTMIDLGAKKCIPCKMMAPILEKLEKAYAGKAAIVFIDVWENNSEAKRFGIRAIPTQIFFDADGKEVTRHTGFMSEDDIVKQLTKMGVIL